jgi:hypothetical protein
MLPGNMEQDALAFLGTENVTLKLDKWSTKENTS